MSTGSTSFDPYSVQLASIAPQFIAALYDAESHTFSVLPNVRCIDVQRHEGASPSAARFEYVFDDSDPNNPYPTGFEHVWPLDAEGDYIVKTDDRIVVLGYDSEGNRILLFDGFASIPQADVHEGGHSVTFSASGAEIRLWDTPVGGARMRDSSVPDSTDWEDTVATELPTRFNPHAESESRPNASPEGFGTVIQEDDVEYEFPVFMDWRRKLKDDDEKANSNWTLSGAIKYLLAVWNDESYVTNPDFGDLTDLLTGRVAKSEGGGDEAPFDPTDPDTYDNEDVYLRDYDATNKHLPQVLQDLLGYHGFGFKFVLEDISESPEGTSLETETRIEVYRKDGEGNHPRSLNYQAHREDLDPGKTNVAAISLARDHHEVASEVHIRTGPTEYEVSIVLAPLFEINSSDATDDNRKNFTESAVANADEMTRRKYRDFGADEDGRGHWVFGGGMFSSFVENEPIDLSDIWPDDEDTGEHTYVERCRPGKHTLVSRDTAGKPYAAFLALSTDYAGDAPALWDGSGTWAEVGTSHWSLLKDRYGVRLKFTGDPDGWTIGQQKEGGTTKAVKVAVVTSLAAPTTQNPRFYLRLTAVFEGDRGIEAVAKKRAASPGRFARVRQVDAREHFRKQVVHDSSDFAGLSDAEAARDDTDRAKAYAEVLRSATEFPALSGTATIPWISDAYRIGDRIEDIEGRGVSLSTSVGDESGEGPRHPVVVGVAWQFKGRQQTTLHLTDRRAEPGGFRPHSVISSHGN